MNCIFDNLAVPLQNCSLDPSMVYSVQFMYTEWERKSSYSIYDILDALFLRAFPYGVHSTGKKKFYIIFFTKLWFGSWLYRRLLTRMNEYPGLGFIFTSQQTQNSSIRGTVLIYSTNANFSHYRHSSISAIFDLTWFIILSYLSSTLVLQGVLALCEFHYCGFSKLLLKFGLCDFLGYLFCYCVHKTKILLMRFLANGTFSEVPKVA